MKHLTVDQTTVNRDLRDRVRNLERSVPGNDRPQREEVIDFPFAGAVAADISVPRMVRWGGQVVAVMICAGTAGSSSSTFRVRVGGTITGSTITLAASATSTIGYIGDHRIPNGSLLTFEVVTVGSGLADVCGSVVLKG